jgi:hypothetical protein
MPSLDAQLAMKSKQTRQNEAISSFDETVKVTHESRTSRMEYKENSGVSMKPIRPPSAPLQGMSRRPTSKPMGLSRPVPGQGSNHTLASGVDLDEETAVEAQIRRMGLDDLINRTELHQAKLLNMGDDPAQRFRDYNAAEATYAISNSTNHASDNQREGIAKSMAMASVSAQKDPLMIQMSYRRKYLFKQGDPRVMHRKRVHAVRKREEERNRKIIQRVQESRREKEAKQHQREQWTALARRTKQMTDMRDGRFKKQDQREQDVLEEKRERAIQARRQAAEKKHNDRALELVRERKKEEQKRSVVNSSHATATADISRERAREIIQEKTNLKEVQARRERLAADRERARNAAVVQQARQRRAAEIPLPMRLKWLPPVCLSTCSCMCSSVGG